MGSDFGETEPGSEEEAEAGAFGRRPSRTSLGHASQALDDVVHCWPRDYWRARYDRADALARRVEQPFDLEFTDLSDFVPREGKARLKVCIATEDFVGPVNNGGIGTTYTHLARLLAAEGHQVTVAYLRGSHAEFETIEYWIDHYAKLGIEFLPVPDDMPFQFVNASRWSRGAVMLLEHLKKVHYDVVHVSEWRGSGMYALIAKRLGLALQDTTIAVKTSSPWLWNRDYGQEAVGNTPDIFKMAMERRSVEMADMVIGGSAHLLRWMASQGYRLPVQRGVYVQPNVVVMGEYRGDSPDRGPILHKGRIRELVFFGRLEARKGLEVFCEAVSLLDRDGLVETVTFMGKAGARLGSSPHLETPDFIRETTASWNAKINILTDCDNHAAISYLCAQPCVAVMPSLIENSSLAVYETTQYRIPFLCSDVGGNAELIHPEDRAAVLFQPRPYPLYDKLRKVAAEGLVTARPSFDNEENLGTWRRFHLRMAELAQSRPPRPAAPEPARVSALVNLRDDGRHALPLLGSLALQDHPRLEVVLIHDEEAPLNEAVQAWVADAEARGLARQVHAGRFLSDAEALAKGVEAASGEYLFLAYEGGRLTRDAVSTFAAAAEHGELDLVTSFIGECGDAIDEEAPAVAAIVTPLGQDVSYDIFDRSVLKSDLLMRADAYVELGGLTDEYKVGGGYAELILRAKLHGLKCDVAPAVLSLRRSLKDPESPIYGDIQRELWRTLRPFSETLPQVFKPLLMGLAGIAPRFADVNERLAKANRDRQSLIEQRDRWKEKAQGGFGGADDFAPPARFPAPGSDEKARGGRKSSRKSAKSADQFDGPVPATIVRRPKGTLEGGVFDIRDGTVLGWALGEDDASLEVVVLKDGDPVAAGLADRRISTVLPIPAAATAHGFSLPLGRVFDEAEEAFTIDILAGPKRKPIVSQFLVQPPSTTLEQILHEGFCENHPAGQIRGWVWRKDLPEACLGIALYVDGELWRVDRADLFRADLLKANKGTGDHGFSIAVPKALRDGTPHVVEVRVAGCGVALRRTPLRIEGEMVTAPPL